MVQVGLDEMEWPQVDVENGMCSRKEQAAKVWIEAGHAAIVENFGCGTLIEGQISD